VWLSLQQVPYGHTISYGGAGQTNRETNCRPGRSQRQQAKQGGHYPPLPPRNRLRWHPYRLWGRYMEEGKAIGNWKAAPLSIDGWL